MDRAPADQHHMVMARSVPLSRGWGGPSLSPSTAVVQGPVVWACGVSTPGAPPNGPCPIPAGASSTTGAPEQ